MRPVFSIEDPEFVQVPEVIVGTGDGAPPVLQIRAEGDGPPSVVI